jgi:HEAT repeat protein
MTTTFRTTLVALAFTSVGAVSLAAQQLASSSRGSVTSRLENQADSAFGVARRALDDGDYRQAAQLFNQLAQRYPRATQAADALYWRAFALFRVGSASNLTAALASLSDLSRLYPSSSANRNDAGPLRIRVCGALAARGDAACAAEVSAAAASPQGQGQAQSCPSADDENDERIMALNALMNMNSDAAVPILERTLARRDACSEGLRKKAVWLISQKRSTNVVDILLRVVREDPSSAVREDAIFWLGNVRDDRVVDVLSNLVNTSTDAAIQEKAIFSLSNTRSERASQVLRDIAQRDNAPKPAREQAIFWLGNRRDPASSEFLRGLYARLNDTDLKDRVLFSLANQRGEGNGRWLIDIATNEREPIELRKKALFHAGNQRAASIADVAALYDRLTDREMKEQAIFTLSQRRETEAVDKLMAIAEKDTDREMRSKAIFWLGQSRDARVLRFLEALINK